MQDKKERLDKILGNFGIGTRKEVKNLIRDGRIRINGEIVKAPETKASLDDEIFLDDELLDRKEFYYLMINKPTGCITATEDPREKTIMSYLNPREQRRGLFPVGRLDKDTEGLLLITNDGKLAHRLASPKHHVWKTYLAKVNGALTPRDIGKFEKGVSLDDGYVCKPARLEIRESGEISTAIVQIQEGKFRQIRRMFASLGKEVIYLQRQKMGELELDPGLELGAYRELRQDEIELLGPPQDD